MANSKHPSERISGLTMGLSVNGLLLAEFGGKRAEVVLVQVDFNRQFFDKFHEVFEKDEGWACEFTDACREKRIDPDDVYLEIRRREETRKKKGLPARVTLLENWHMGDERRYDEDQAERRKQAAKKRRKKESKQQAKALESPKPTPTLGLHRSEKQVTWETMGVVLFLT